MSWGSTGQSIFSVSSQAHVGGEAAGSCAGVTKEIVKEIVAGIRCSMREELLAAAREVPRFGSISDRSELLDCVRQGVREEISTALSSGVGLAETPTTPGMVPHSYVHSGTAHSIKTEAVAREVIGTITLPEDENMQNVVPTSFGGTGTCNPDDWVTKYARGYLADSVLAKPPSDETPLAIHSGMDEPASYSSFWRRSRRKVARLVKSRLFNIGASFFVVLSAALIGAQVDYMAKHIDAASRPPWPFVVGDVLFLVIFTVEILLRIFANGLQLYRMQGWQWYAFDTVLVVLQLLETCLSFIQFSHIAVLRMVRIIRLFRIIRVVRVLHLVREFRTIIIAMGKAIRPFLLAFLLLMFLIYIVGIYILQIVLDHYIGDSEAFYSNPKLQKYWPSLGVVILSLFQSLLGGVDWENVLDPLAQSVSPWMAPFFMTFIAFATFVLMNLITGIFFELTLSTLNEIKDRELLKQMTELFLEADDNHSGFICYPEFEQQLKNPLLEKYFQEIDMHFSEAKGLFNLLDTDNTGRVDAQDFVMGCLRLRGNARALEMATMASHMQQSLKVLIEMVDLLGSSEGSSQQTPRYAMPRLMRRTRPSLLP